MTTTKRQRKSQLDKEIEARGQQLSALQKQERTLDERRKRLEEEIKELEQWLQKARSEQTAAIVAKDQIKADERTLRLAKAIEIVFESFYDSGYQRMFKR